MESHYAFSQQLPIDWKVLNIFLFFILLSSSFISLFLSLSPFIHNLIDKTSLQTKQKNTDFHLEMQES